MDKTPDRFIAAAFMNELLALAQGWQDKAAGTWGESKEHAALQQCCDELRDKLSAAWSAGISAVTATEFAIRLHEAYERLAPSFGYETRTETRDFDPNSANGRLMIAVCEELSRTPAATVVGWRPIAEAPVGVSVICYDEMRGRFIAFQEYIIEGCPDTVWESWDGDRGIVPPTLWQDLPAPPAGAG